MNQLVLFQDFLVINETVKEVSTFAADDYYKYHYYIKGEIVVVGTDPKKIDFNALKDKFTSLGYDFNEELDLCAEGEHDRMGGSDYFFRFLTYVADQPGVIGFQFGNRGQVEFMRNKNFKIESSPAFIKLLNFLKKRGVDTMQRPGVWGDVEIATYLEETPTTRSKSSIPDFYYHGTSSRYFDSIIKQGIAPSKTKSNFNIGYTDRVFITTDIETAKEYAMNSASNHFSAMHFGEDFTDDNPVVFKISSKLLDQAKIVMDFDLYKNFMRDRSIKKYDDYLDSQNHQYTSSAKTKLRKNIDPALFYKIGYLGTILPQSIIGVVMNNEVIPIAQAATEIKR